MNNDMGLVYVIGNAANNTVKIGYAADLDRRLKELRTAYLPHGIRASALIALREYRVPHARQLEYFLHAQFARSRLPREGFVIQSRRPGGQGWTEWFALGSNGLARIDFRVAQFVGGYS
jgi:hypothetical protein